MKGQRFEALTGFRAIAAILVFLYHNRKHWRDHLHPEVLRSITFFCFKWISYCLYLQGQPFKKQQTLF
jgi:peptidoglycan/LPS O-acetylase OafA/YrhL